MPIQTTYSDARARLAELLDRVVDDRETVIITRHGEVAVAMIAADELEGLQETAHLLKSPKNAERLFAAMADVAEGKGVIMPLEDLLKEHGLGRP